RNGRNVDLGMTGAVVRYPQLIAGQVGRRVKAQLISVCSHRDDQVGAGYERRSTCREWNVGKVNCVSGLQAADRDSSQHFIGGAPYSNSHGARTYFEGSAGKRDKIGGIAPVELGGTAAVDSCIDCSTARFDDQQAA